MRPAELHLTGTLASPEFSTPSYFRRPSAAFRAPAIQPRRLALTRVVQVAAASPAAEAVEEAAAAGSIRPGLKLAFL